MDVFGVIDETRGLQAGQTAGYGDEVIFADGTFIDGSTAELSADGPLRAPYVIYCQGGTHWTHWAICLEAILPALDGVEGSKGVPRSKVEC
jgi:cystathionine beta-lyase family protein involved in aluminum resistance